MYFLYYTFSNEINILLTVLTQQDSAAAQQYIRQGSPTALRAELWALILNISSHPEVRKRRMSQI